MLARSAEAQSLSITASTPRSWPSRATTGTPPPPQAIVSAPASRSVSIGSDPTIASGRGRARGARLVPGLRAVPVRDDDPRLLEERPELGQRAAQVRQLLGRGPALVLARQGVPAQRDDCRHPTGVGVSTRPCSESTSA